MEIVSYVLEGALEHKDSMGTGSIILPGDVQRMSAGTGVRTASSTRRGTARPLPPDMDRARQNGAAPGYEQKTFDDEQKCGRLRLVALPDGADGSVTLHADVHLYATYPLLDEDVGHPHRRAGTATRGSTSPRASSPRAT